MIFQFIAIGIGLSMDAFAASMCKGLSMNEINHKRAVAIAGFFGISQALMPVLGWVLGINFISYISPIDHWIVFGLLGAVGAKMIIDSFKTEKEEKCDEKFSYLDLFLLAIATSIDALVVGLSFGILGSPIVLASIVIGVTTFSLSFAGVYIGYYIGGKFRKAAEIIGGTALILIGLQILLQHLEII
ncbi:MAG: manganese efflux pump [Ruminococcaceae bacterium]|nr:manganese efflux pump [Oscillospiraceae bacterium]